MRTIGEVLEVMIDQNESTLRTEERAVLMAKTAQGQLLGYLDRPNDTLSLLLAALDEITTAVHECRQDAADAVHNQDNDGTVRHNEPSDSDHDDFGDGEENVEDLQGRLAMRRKRLRTALEVQHAIAFFVASAYYQLKSDATLTQENSERYQELEQLEAAYYEKARQIRQELLSQISRKANQKMTEVRSAQSKKLTSIPRIEPFAQLGGIESRRIADQIEDFRQILNAQADQIDEWRKKLAASLLSELVDQEPGEIKGEEYEESTKQQDEQYSYWFTLRAAIADRHELVSGQVNTLVAHEVQDALKQAAEKQGHSPELLQLALRERSKFAPNPKARVSFRAIISEVRDVITSVRFSRLSQTRATAEMALLEDTLSELQQTSNRVEQNSVRLDKELMLLRSTMNTRLEFYKQLQVLSDAVAPLDETTDVEFMKTRLKQEAETEQHHSNKLVGLKRKRTFLAHLRESETSEQKEPRICIICQSPFDRGLLTVCGHQYCKDCMLIWWREHHSCPMCKRHLSSTDFNEVTYKSQEIHAQEEGYENDPSSSSSKQRTNDSNSANIYTAINAGTLDQIRSIELSQSFGTKIDILARHIIWLRDKDPGAKSIVFSQYREFLEFLGTAFNALKVGYASSLRRQNVADFRDDPSKECYLLHARSYSSGLNLTNATHVFLCEPLINTAIELQAIARVHRIGQQRQTTVWMYLIAGTVEEAIYELSVERRLEHIEKAETGSRLESRHHPAVEEDTLDESNMMQLQTAEVSSLMARGQNSGEFVGNDDLWRSLFGKPGSHDHHHAGNREDGELQMVVGGHLRGEAAEARRTGGQ